MAAVNAFHSHLVLSAASDRSIAVMDMNKSAISRHIPQAQKRPIHAIRINEGSPFVAHAAGMYEYAGSLVVIVLSIIPRLDSYNLFATSAVADGVALWDLRADGCVRRYNGHISRAHPVGMAISPCGRFLATGSEDRCCYVYDMRCTIIQHLFSPSVTLCGAGKTRRTCTS
jgi:WD40 repeat protein